MHILVKLFRNPLFIQLLMVFFCYFVIGDVFAQDNNKEGYKFAPSDQLTKDTESSSRSWWFVLVDNGVWISLAFLVICLLINSWRRFVWVPFVIWLWFIIGDDVAVGIKKAANSTGSASIIVKKYNNVV